MKKEIEFKNLLTNAEYEILLKKYPFNNYFSQINYYFDFTNQSLLHKNQMLRVRKIGSIFELTLKVKEDKFVAEYNQNITLSDFMNLNATGVLPAGLVLNTIQKEHDINYFFTMFGLLKTDRSIYKDGNYLICLDKNDYLNGIDYELEIECLNYDEGEIYFNNFLNTHKITKVKTLPKVARFMERLEEGHTCSTRKKV